MLSGIDEICVTWRLWIWFKEPSGCNLEFIWIRLEELDWICGALETTLGLILTTLGCKSWLFFPMEKLGLRNLLFSFVFEDIVDWFAVEILENFEFALLVSNLFKIVDDDEQSILLLLLLSWFSGEFERLEKFVRLAPLQLLPLLQLLLLLFIPR